MPDVQDLIFEYNGILTFVKECAESGLEEFIELENRLSSFGENLNNYLYSNLNEIKELKEELNAQKIEADEIIEKLNKKLKLLSNSMSAADYQLCTLACQKDYAKYWDLLAEDSKTFLITSYFVLKKIIATKSDFSAVVLCLCKPFENELRAKVYEPFIIKESTLPFIEKDSSKLAEGIKYYKKKLEFYLPIKIMIINFEPPKFKNSYQQKLQNDLFKSGWKMNLLTNQQFIEDGVEYMEKYRNLAAHTTVLEKQIAIDCRLETKRIIERFLSAYPNKK